MTGASLFTSAGNIGNWVSCKVVGTHQGRGCRRQWITRGGGIRGLSDASAEESGSDERRASDAARGEPLSVARAHWEPWALEFALEAGRAWGYEWRREGGWWWDWWRISGSELPFDIRIFHALTCVDSMQTSCILLCLYLLCAEGTLGSLCTALYILNHIVLKVVASFIWIQLCLV